VCFYFLNWRKVKTTQAEASATQTMISWIMRHMRSRYVHLLEQEVERLRAENRALVNSLLGTAGFPPVSLDDDLRRGAAAMTPVRRRSWAQIAREREFAAAKGLPEK
jgi:hypothetical protein